MRCGWRRRVQSSSLNVTRHSAQRLHGSRTSRLFEETTVDFLDQNSSKAVPPHVELIQMGTAGWVSRKSPTRQPGSDLRTISRGDRRAPRNWRVL